MAWLKKIKKYRRLIWLMIILIIAIFVIGFFFFPSRRRVQANSCVFQTETARSAFKQYRGLSGRKQLATNGGMLFLFSKAEEQAFVMRQMYFPLDIIFIRNHRVVNLYNNLPPEGKTPAVIYHSGALADAVLEIAGGQSRACHLGVGSEISW